VCIFKKPLPVVIGDGAKRPAKFSACSVIAGHSTRYSTSTDKLRLQTDSTRLRSVPSGVLAAEWNSQTSRLLLTHAAVHTTQACYTNSDWNEVIIGNGYTSSIGNCFPEVWPEAVD